MIDENASRRKRLRAEAGREIRSFVTFLPRFGPIGGG